MDINPTENVHSVSDSTTSDSSESSDSSDSSDYDVIVKRSKRFQERINLDYYDDKEVLRRFRFTKNGINYLTTLLNEKLSASDNRGYPLTVTQQILITLRYFATGSFQIVTGDLIGIYQTTAGRIIHKVAKAIASLSTSYIKMPANSIERRRIETQIYSIKRFPNCIGFIDGCQIPIRSPGADNAELYRNRKGFFSINTQYICDAKGKVLDVVAR